MAIFDTNIIIDHLRGVHTAMSVLEKYSGNERIGLSSVTVYELATGVKNKEEEDGLSLLLSNSEVYPFDLRSALEATAFFKKLRSTGSELSIADTLILGTAMAHDEMFVTQDTGFEGAYDKVVIVKKARSKD